MKNYNPHRWSIGAFDDGSAMWLVEWKSELESRERMPSGKVNPWTLDAAMPQHRGWEKEQNKLERETALAILEYWRLERIMNGGE